MNSPVRTTWIDIAPATPAGWLRPRRAWTPPWRITAAASRPSSTALAHGRTLTFLARHLMAAA